MLMVSISKHIKTYSNDIRGSLDLSKLILHL